MEEATAVVGDQGVRGRPAQEAARRGRAEGGADPAPGASDRRDHGREPGAKKGALGLEDHGQMPPPLQKEVHATVVQTKERSEWPARKTLAALGIARRRYDRWLKEEKGVQVLPPAPIKPVQRYEALAGEKRATVDYARTEP